MKLRSLLLCFTLMAPGPVRAQAATALARPDTALPAMLDALRPGSALPTREFIQQQFVPGADSGWVNARLAQLADLKARTGGLEEVTVTARQPSRLTVRAREHRTGWSVGLTIVVDSLQPHRVASFSLQPARPRSAVSPGLIAEPELLAEVSGLVSAYCAADIFSGVVAIARGTTILYREACGDAIKGYPAPNTVDTRFNLASISKMFTAVAIARLIESGAVSLSDAVAAYLPDVPTPEAASKVRIEHLLTHTSGLPDMFTDEYERSSKSLFRSVDHYVDLVRGEPLAFEPGSRAQYSNTGFLLLGKIIEVVTGQDFFEHVRAQVLVPAGMTSTCFCELDQPNPNLAVGYVKQYREGGVTFRNNFYSEPVKGSPAGGAFSTAEDMVRFAAALEAGQLVGQSLVQAFTTPKPEVHPDLTAYGYGFITRRGGRTFGHNGGGSGVSAEVEMFRERGYTMVVLSNYSGIGAEVAARIRTLMVQGLPN